MSCITRYESLLFSLICLINSSSVLVNRIYEKKYDFHNYVVVQYTRYLSITITLFVWSLQSTTIRIQLWKQFREFFTLLRRKIHST
jgi:hypothetical protein